MPEILKWRQLGIDHGIQAGIQFLPTSTRGRKERTPAGVQMGRVEPHGGQRAHGPSLSRC